MSNKRELIKVSPALLVVPCGSSCVRMLQNLLCWYSNIPRTHVRVTHQYGPGPCDYFSSEVEVLKKEDGFYVDLTSLKEEPFYQSQPMLLLSLIKHIDERANKKTKIEL